MRSDLKLVPRRQTGPVPLSFTQLTYWHDVHLNDRLGQRNLVATIRLRGKLNLRFFQESFDCVVLRHEALRTRLVLMNGSPQQEVQESVRCKVELEDFSSVPEGTRDAEIAQLIQRTMLEQVDVTTGPMLAAKLARIADDEHVLILALEPMICDEFSAALLVRDTLSMYHVFADGRRANLPSVGVQFPDFAVWQNKTSSAWLRRYGSYWKHRLAGSRRLRFPIDSGLNGASRPGWGVTPIQINSDLKRQLRAWCDIRRTDLVLTLLAVFGALVLRWCQVSRGVIRFQTDGRFSPQLRNTIGFFASMLHLRVELGNGDRFIDLANRLTVEYRDANEHHDLSHMDAQLPRPEFTYNPCFKWVSRGPSIDNSEQQLQVDPVRFSELPMQTWQTDSEPVMWLYDSDADINGGIYFPMSRLSHQAMNEFAAAFMRFISMLLREPDRRIVEVPLRGL